MLSEAINFLCGIRRYDDATRRAFEDCERVRQEMSIRQLEHFTGRDRMDIAINGFPASDLFHPSHLNQSADLADMINYNKIIPTSSSSRKP